MKKLLIVILSLTFLFSHSYVNAGDKLYVGLIKMGKNESEEFIENFFLMNKGEIFPLKGNINLYEVDDYNIDFTQYFDFLNKDNISRFMIETNRKGFIKDMFISFKLDDKEMIQAQKKYAIDKKFCKVIGNYLLFFKIRKRHNSQGLEIQIMPDHSLI